VAAMLLAAGLALGLLIGGAQPVAVGLVPAPWDKLAHTAVFAVLASAIGYASGLRGWRMLLVAFGVAVAVGALDEWHQMYLPGRSAGLDDLAADAVGAALGAAATLWRGRSGR
jgi:VanZ family protein